jgi:myo-inositol 2-dehydrogenase/D-chiro-inositol 1-dehydrogenase
VEAARTAGLQLYPAHVVRYSPEYALLKNAVDQGLLGELAVLRFVRSGSFPVRAWFADMNLSGGIIMDQMIHDLDLARWVAGEVVRVSAIRHRTGTPEQPVEGAHVTLTHASGAITHCSGIWGPAHLPFTTEYSVTGSLGSLSHSSRAERSFIAELADGAEADGFLPEIDPAENPYFLELDSFLAAFAGRGTPRVSAEDGLAAVRIANAALESLSTGQPVVLNPVLAEVR